MDFVVSGIPLDQADRLIAAARRAAVDLGQSVCVAVVEKGGTLVASARMDGAPPGAVDAAKRKADIAVALGFDTVQVTTPLPGGQSIPGGLQQPEGHSLVPNGGGVVIRVRGAIVGAVGVCGAASSIVDHKIGTAAVSGLP